MFQTTNQKCKYAGFHIPIVLPKKETQDESFPTAKPAEKLRP